MWVKKKKDSRWLHGGEEVHKQKKITSRILPRCASSFFGLINVGNGSSSRAKLLSHT